MSDEFFTRETWRAGKNGRMRKRVKPWGGRKTAPPAFLEAGKRTWFGAGAHQICTAMKRDGSPCGMVALKGLKVCGAHGGFRSWRRSGKLQRTGRTAERQAEFRAAMVEGRSPAVPIELTRLREYREANDWTRIRMARAWDTAAWIPLMREIRKAMADCV